MGRSLRNLKIGFYGFVTAVIGVAIGFCGFAIDTRWLSVIGFGITVVGVSVSFVSIAYGLIAEGRYAITGSVNAARDLSQKIRRLLSPRRIR